LEKFKEIQLIVTPNEQPVVLQNDVDTRWNSTIIMLWLFLRLQVALTRTLRELNKFTTVISDTYPTLLFVYSVVHMIKHSVDTMVLPIGIATIGPEFNALYTYQVCYL